MTTLNDVGNETMLSDAASDIVGRSMKRQRRPTYDGRTGRMASADADTV